MRVTRSTDRTHTISLESRIDRAFWSRQIAMNGDEVKIHVETVMVPDGTPLTVTIKERTPDGGETVLTEIESTDLASRELILDYTVELEEEAGDEEDWRELREVLFVVTIPDYELTNEDDPPVLPVDSGPFEFSQ